MYAGLQDFIIYYCMHVACKRAMSYTSAMLSRTYISGRQAQLLKARRSGGRGSLLPQAAS
jgi:hypothetical protein